MIFLDLVPDPGAYRHCGDPFIMFDVQMKSWADGMKVQRVARQ
jgi:hypothetical protein